MVETAENPKQISWEEHQLWCKNLKREYDLFYFSTGPVRLGVFLINLKTNYWSFYLDPYKRFDRGIASIFLSMAIWFLQKHLSLKEIKAKVLKSNGKSIHLHKKMGFVKMRIEDENFIHFRKET